MRTEISCRTGGARGANLALVVLDLLKLLFLPPHVLLFRTLVDIDVTLQVLVRVLKLLNFLLVIVD